MQRAFSYRFYPTLGQEFLLRRMLGCMRLVYSRALAARRTAWATESQSISYLQTSTMLTAWKRRHDLELLHEVSSVPLQQCLRHLQTAFSNCFARRANHPTFQHNGGSAAFNRSASRSALRWCDRQLFLAQCSEPLPIRWSRQIPEGCKPSSVTVSLSPAGLAVATCGAPARPSSKHRGRQGQSGRLSCEAGHLRRLRRRGSEKLVPGPRRAFVWLFPR